MTAQPHPNHQLFKSIAHEEKVKREFDLRAKVEQYRLLCENKHLHALVVNKEQRITQLEQELETSQKKNKDLEQKVMDFEKRHNKRKAEMLTGNIAGSSNMEPQVTNTDTTESVAARVEQLFKFTKDGNVSEVKSIIASGVDVNVVDGGGFSPLHYAADRGHVAVCEYLLDKGADVNAKTRWGATPLHRACYNGLADVVKLLVVRDASVAITDINESTPLHFASLQGHRAVCEHLLDEGADVNARNRLGNTPLHRACYNGHVDVVKLLIACDAFVSVKNTFGRTPLSLAQEAGHTSVYKYLK